MRSNLIIYAELLFIIYKGEVYIDILIYIIMIFVPYLLYNLLMEDISLIIQQFPATILASCRNQCFYAW